MFPAPTPSRFNSLLAVIKHVYSKFSSAAVFHTGLGHIFAPCFVGLRKNFKLSCSPARERDGRRPDR